MSRSADSPARLGLTRARSGAAMASGQPASDQPVSSTLRHTALEFCTRLRAAEADIHVEQKQQQSLVECKRLLEERS